MNKILMITPALFVPIDHQSLVPGIDHDGVPDGGEDIHLSREMIGVYARFAVAVNIPFVPEKHAVLPDFNLPDFADVAVGAVQDDFFFRQVVVVQRQAPQDIVPAEVQGAGRSVETQGAGADSLGVLPQRPLGRVEVQNTVVVCEVQDAGKALRDVPVLPSGLVGGLAVIPHGQRLGPAERPSADEKEKKRVCEFPMPHTMMIYGKYNTILPYC